METRSEQSGSVKEGTREILKSEYTKKRTNNTIQLVKVPKNSNSFKKRLEGMQLETTMKHILTLINKLVLRKFCITTLGIYDFSEIDTLITATEKCEGERKKLGSD